MQHQARVSRCWHSARLESLGGAVLQVSRIKEVVQRNVNFIGVAKIVIAIGVSKALRVDECCDTVSLICRVCCEMILEPGDHDLGAA
jgi:hypothetical protein